MFLIFRSRDIDDVVACGSQAPLPVSGSLGPHILTLGCILLILLLSNFRGNLHLQESVGGVP
jgi:hypothetical protein